MLENRCFVWPDRIATFVAGRQLDFLIGKSRSPTIQCEGAGNNRSSRADIITMPGEGRISVLPFWLNLDYFSVLRLSSFIISLCIAVYLFRLKKRSESTLWLAWVFTGGALINLSTFLEFSAPYYWQPYNLKNLFMPFLQALAVAISAFSLLSFAYHSPHFQKPDLREYRAVRFLSILANLLVLGLTYYNFIHLKRLRSNIGFEGTYYNILYTLLAAQFVLAVALLLRKVVRFSTGRARPWWRRLFNPQGKDARAAGSLALVLGLPAVVLGVYLLENRGVLPLYPANYLIWLIFLLFYCSFVVTYLNHTTDRTTIQVKLVGVVLVFVVAVLGLISLFAGRTYQKDYHNKNLIPARRTIHFTPNRFESYTISTVPYRFDQDLGSKLELDYDQSVALELAFPFHFYADAYTTVQVLHGPMIILGEEIGGKDWGGYNPKPAIAPLLVNLDTSQGGGIYFKNQPDRFTLTWYEISEYGYSNKNTIQLSLHRDGSIDFSYKEIQIDGGYNPIQMYVYTSATVTGHHPGAAGEQAPIGPRLIGLHPGHKGAKLQPVRFTGGLPHISTAPEVLFEAYDIDFYRHLHSRMAVLVVILIGSSLSILFVLPFLFKTNLIQPLQALHRGMERANSGDFRVSITPQSNDEIGALTLYFNRMLQSIRKAEANFRAMADNARDGILIVLEEGRIAYSNRSAEQITMRSSAELRGTPIAEVIRQQKSRTDSVLFWSDADEKRETKHLEANVIHDGKTGGPVEMTVSKTSWHGTPASVVMLRDISERKRREEEDRQYQHRMIQTDKLTTLGILAGEVAHEISNPNQVILAIAGLLNRAWSQIHRSVMRHISEQEPFLIAGFQQEEFVSNIAGWLGDIEANSEKIDSIVKGLKSYIRNEPEVMSSVDLSSVVRSAAQLMAYHVKRATDNFSLRLEDTMPNMRGNAQQLEQVVINLILNACQALLDRDGAVEVETTANKEQGSVILTVRDQGCGISEENLRRITEPMFTTKRETGGIGLGLYITDSIVREHRGTLRFTSVPGSGTEVVVTFPVEDSK
jgi:PAS domain S-box-containing protein